MVKYKLHKLQEPVITLVNIKYWNVSEVAPKHKHIYSRNVDFFSHQ